eukprot:COSAG01_NODE_439_length_17034_cov_5.326484_14_plen_252_part_00
MFLRRLGSASAVDAKPPPAIEAADVGSIAQTLHLWNGSLASTFVLDSEPVRVDSECALRLSLLVTAHEGGRAKGLPDGCCSRTHIAAAVHPEHDVLAVRVCSALVARGSLGVGLALPYAAAGFAGGTDWAMPGRHASARLPGRPLVLNHTLDNTSYFVHSAAHQASVLQPGSAPHDWIIAASSTGTRCLDVSLWFSRLLLPAETALPSTAEVFSASAAGWARKWQVRNSAMRRPCVVTSAVWVWIPPKARD